MLLSIAYKNSIFENNPIRKIVSKKKIRFEFEGFDLDLTYITDKIIAMGYPADNIEKIYRNPLEEVNRFFAKRHNNRYKVYNLCAERVYPLNTFQAQAYFPFEDHEAPNIDMILPFCEDVHKWLSAHPQNIVAIHCKAGKGRTGLMICCYLIYLNFLGSAEQALKYYGLMRTSNGKGVTIQSQIRYTEFFEEIVKRRIPYPLNSSKLQLKKIKFNTVPNFNLLCSGCTPYFEIRNDNYSYSHKDNIGSLIDYSLLDKIEFSLPEVFLKGDFQVVFHNDRLIGSVKMFKFWFNTYFVPSNGVIVMKKKYLDLKQKDHKSLFLSEDFKVELVFDMGNSVYTEKENELKENKDEEDVDYFKDVDVNKDFKMFL
jgi:phosphatidylinositol-3,4,5-trisphosphate 3-phosphatase/dual-specificity protein phosphatase PTEN